MSTGLLMLCFSRSFWTGCTPVSFLACLVGWRRMGTTAFNLRSADQKFGCWCWHGKGPHFNVFVWRCWADSAPILPWRLQSWQKFLMLLVPIHLLCLCMGATCVGRGFCKLFGKWIPCETRGIPPIWSPAIEALPPANCCILVWEPGPILHDRVRGKSSEGCRDSGLDGVLSCIAQSHHHQRSLHARPCWCGGKHCRGMATGGVVLEGDWPQRRWR